MSFRYHLADKAVWRVGYGAMQLAGDGVFGPPLSTTGQFAGRAIDLCSGGDPICSQGRDRSAHNNYDGPPYLDQAANL
jgi:hypothetical protein